MGVAGYQSRQLGKLMAQEVVNELERLRQRGIHPTYQKVLDAIGRIPREPLTLLDVGCGAGLYCAVLESADWITYEGADFNEFMLSKARELFPGIAFHFADARKMPFGDDSYNVVLAGAMLEHIKEWQDALREMCRVAKSHLILHRTLLTLGNKRTRIERQIAYDEDVWRVYINRSSLEKQLAKNGWRITGDGAFVAHEAGQGKQWTFLVERIA